MKLGIIDLILSETFCCKPLAWGNHLVFFVFSAFFIVACLYFWDLSQAATGIWFALLVGFIKVFSNGIYSAILQLYNPKLLDGV